MNPPPECEPNPYQSPAERSPADGSFATGPRYGLREPICVQGVASTADYREAIAAVGSEGITVFQHVLIFAIVVVGMPILSILDDGFSLLPLAFSFSSLAAWGLFVLLFVIVPRLRARRELRRWESNVVYQRFTIMEEAIRIETDNESSMVRWAQFSGYRCTERVVALLIELSGPGLLVPKSFFADETTWATFVALVRCKLPDQRLEKIVRREEQIAPAGFLDSRVEDEPGEQEGPTDTNAATIVGEGVLSPSEVLKALRIAQRLSWRTLFPYFFLGALLLTAVQAIAWNAFEPLLLVPLGTGVGVVVTFWLVIPRWQLRQQWRRQAGIFEPRRFVISCDCLKVSTPTVAATSKWDSISRCVVKKGLLIMYFGDDSFHIIPKSFFRHPGDWDSLLKLAQEKVASFKRR